MDEIERRANPNPMDVAGALAILYTGIFAATVLLLLFVEIPNGNKDPLLQLFGLMSAIQMAIVAFYYGSSKSGEASQRAIEQRQGRSEAIVQEIAKTVPVAAAAAASTASGGGTITTDKLEVDATGASIKIEKSPPDQPRGT